MKAQIPWLRVFVEGVVIVLSILLAFGLQAWWDGVQEREQESEALEALAQDFSENIQALRDHVDRSEQIQNAGLAVLEMGPSLQAAPRDSVIEMLDLAVRINDVQPVMAAYHDMVNSGDLRLLQSDRLRVLLAQFESGLELQDETIQAVWDHWFAFEEPILIEAHAFGEMLPSYFDIRLPPTALRADLARLEQSDFLTVITMRVALQHDVVRRGGDLLAVAREIRSLLEQSLNAGSG